MLFTIISSSTIGFGASGVGPPMNDESTLSPSFEVGLGVPSGILLSLREKSKGYSNNGVLLLGTDAKLESVTWF